MPDRPEDHRRVAETLEPETALLGGLTSSRTSGIEARYVMEPRQSSIPTGMYPRHSVRTDERRPSSWRRSASTRAADAVGGAGDGRYRRSRPLRRLEPERAPIRRRGGDPGAPGPRGASPMTLNIACSSAHQLAIQTAAYMIARASRPDRASWSRPRSPRPISNGANPRLPFHLRRRWPPRFCSSAPEAASGAHWRVMSCRRQTRIRTNIPTTTASCAGPATQMEDRREHAQFHAETAARSSFARCCLWWWPISRAPKRRAEVRPGNLSRLWLPTRRTRR